MKCIEKAHIPPGVERKLSEHCARRGTTRAAAVVRALDQYLDREVGGPSLYALATDLIPQAGVTALQSDNLREVVRKAFRGRRTMTAME